MQEDDLYTLKNKSALSGEMSFHAADEEWLVEKFGDNLGEILNERFAPFKK